MSIIKESEKLTNNITNKIREKYNTKLERFIIGKLHDYGLIFNTTQELVDFAKKRLTQTSEDINQQKLMLDNKTEICSWNTQIKTRRENYELVFYTDQFEIFRTRDCFVMGE